MEHTHPDPSTTSRRRFLSGVTAGTASLVGVAGCIDGPGGGSRIEEGTGYASFFTLADWGNQVGGEHFEFENPIEVGEIGHGWDPDFDILAEAATREVFFYLDTPEFAWSQEVAATLVEDHQDVVVIDGISAIQPSKLLSFDDTLPPRQPPDEADAIDPESFAIGEFDIIDLHTGDTAAWWHDDHWHGGIPAVPLDGSRNLRVHIEDDQGRVPRLGSDETFQLHARVADGAPDDLVEFEVDGESVTIHGLDAGQTLAVFELHAGESVVFSTADDETVLTVAESDDIEVDVFFDPHVWVDPRLAVDIIDDLAATLADVDPEHAAAYHSNAEDYIAQIDELHAAIEETVSRGSIETVVFAGHHAFGYIADRYGIEFHTPVGVSPDADVTLSDVSNLAQVIESNDIDTVLYDPFEAPDPDQELPPMVDVLLEETGAEEAMPLTAAEGTTPAWRDSGYGWLEQWTEINLPSLEAALQAG